MFKDKDNFNDYANLTEEKIDAAIAEAAQRVKKYIPYFDKGYPTEASKNNVYPVMDYRSWVEGFYPGILFLCYEFTGDKSFCEAAENHLDDFKKRVEEKDSVDTHDLGFLYSLSCVAEYKLTGNEEAKKAALLAAEYLTARFQEKGQFIQAWGEMGAKENYRLIIDCLLNLPLLHWAYEMTGDEKYHRIACAHLETTMRVIVRPDGSTHHTFYFDDETGEPKYGRTHQGYNDDSAWARGQSWGVYGLMLNYFYTHNNDILPLWFKVTDYYLDNLPKDKIAYWDLCFKDGDEPRDSSSDVIAACGLLEAYKQGICGREYFEAAKSILNAVIDKCSTKNEKESNGLIMHATYNISSGADECNIWGDYFYLEALMRLKKNWKMYW